MTVWQVSWQAVTVWQFIIAALFANGYFILLCFRPWRTTAAGRALWTKALGNVILLNMFLAALLWPDYAWRPYVRFVGLVVFDAGLIYLFTVLWRTPRLGRDRDEHLEPWQNPGYEEQPRSR